MKKTLIFVGLASTLALSACGIDTEQMGAITDGIDMMQDMGEIGDQDGLTEQEKINAGLDVLGGGLGDMMDNSDTPLTDEEKDTLMEGADMLKNGGAGVNNMLNDAIGDLDKEADAEEKAKKAEALEKYGESERPEWAIEKEVVVPEGLKYQYRTSASKEIMSYKAKYTKGSVSTMTAAKKIIDNLNLEISDHSDGDEMGGAFVMASGETDLVIYNLSAGNDELILKVTNKNWFKEDENAHNARK